MSQRERRGLEIDGEEEREETGRFLVSPSTESECSSRSVFSSTVVKPERGRRMTEIP